MDIIRRGRPYVYPTILMVQLFIGNLFLSEKLVDCFTALVDSSMLQALGPVWHKSDMNNNHLPISGIDTGAKWGYSKSKGS